MDFNYLFTWGVFIPVFVTLVFVVKTIFDTGHLKKNMEKNYLILHESLIQETGKLEKNREKLLLVDNLHKTLFNRLFKITREIILVQKFIFETHIK